MSPRQKIRKRLKWYMKKDKGMVSYETIIGIANITKRSKFYSFPINYNLDWLQCRWADCYVRSF